MKTKPKTLVEFEREFPRVWKAFANFRDACDGQGPLNEKTCELIKVAVETACGRRGGLAAHIHRARRAGAAAQEIEHAILLAAPLIGMPAILDAFLIAKRHVNRKG